MSRSEKFLPFLLAIFIPIVSAINNGQEFGQKEIGPNLLRLVEVSCVLLGVWFLNKWLLTGDYGLARRFGRSIIMIPANLLIVTAIVSIDYFLISDGITSFVPVWFLAIRMSVGIMLFITIIYAFQAQKDRSQLRFQNLELQAENLKFQVGTLKQQINPHFLFNSLNTLLDLVEDNQEAAAKYIRSFSNLYRVVLQSAQHDFIPLSDELKFLNNYWELLKVRFKDAIKLEVSVSDEKLQYLIPPLCLQFLIENAVKHNKSSVEDPLTVTIKDQGTELIISNRIQPLNQPAVSENVGLKNLQQRFTLLFQPIEYGVEDEAFIVRIPLKTEHYEN